MPEGAEEEIPQCEKVPTTWWLSGLVVSTALCTAILSPLFNMPVRPGKPIFQCPSVADAEKKSQIRSTAQQSRRPASCCHMRVCCHLWVKSRAAPRLWVVLPAVATLSDAFQSAAGVAAAGGRGHRAAGGAAGGAGAGRDGPEPRLRRRQAVPGAPHTHPTLCTQLPCKVRGGALWVASRGCER